MFLFFFCIGISYLFFCSYAYVYLHIYIYICMYVYDDGRYDMISSLMIGNDLVCYDRRHVLGIFHLI